MASFWVAIDHSNPDLFFREPDQGDVCLDPRPDIRSDVVSTAFDQSDCWGLVVPADWVEDHPEHASRCCLGLLDIHDAEMIPLIDVSRTRATAVKVGFDHVRMNCADAAAELVARMPAGAQVFLEPYCGRYMCLRALAEYAVEQERQVILKVAVDEPHLHAFCSSRAVATGVTWVARSDGVPWLEYVRQLDQVAALGGAGVMVGRALWGDVVQMAYEVRRRELINRMQRIATVFADECLAVA